jgi:Cu+-exporting ATPase
MQVVRTSAAAHRHAGAGTVSFCSAGCAAAFDAQPQRYDATEAGASPGVDSR